MASPLPARHFTGRWHLYATKAGLPKLLFQVFWHVLHWWILLVGASLFSGKVAQWMWSRSGREAWKWFWFAFDSAVGSHHVGSQRCDASRPFGVVLPWRKVCRNTLKIYFQTAFSNTGASRVALQFTFWSHCFLSKLSRSQSANGFLPPLYLVVLRWY